MSRLQLLKKRQSLLFQEITAHLDSFLIGTVAKSPSMSGYNLTTKVQGQNSDALCPKRSGLESVGDGKAL